MEHADDVVGRGVIRPFFISLIKAVELGADDPEWKRNQKHDRLAGQAKATCARLARVHELRDDKCQYEARQVAGQQRATHEPATPPDSPRVATQREDLARAFIDDLVET